MTHNERIIKQLLHSAELAVDTQRANDISHEYAMSFHTFLSERLGKQFEDGEIDGREFCSVVYLTALRLLAMNIEQSVVVAIANGISTRKSVNEAKIDALKEFGTLVERAFETGCDLGEDIKAKIERGEQP